MGIFWRLIPRLLHPDKSDDRLAAFDYIWRLEDAVTRYPTLARFCGGFATVFPNTANVEADFSILGGEKNKKRTSLTDLSLEGIMHCKQWSRLALAAE